MYSPISIIHDILPFPFLFRLHRRDFGRDCWRGPASARGGVAGALSQLALRTGAGQSAVEGGLSGHSDARKREGKCGSENDEGKWNCCSLWVTFFFPVQTWGKYFMKRRIGGKMSSGSMKASDNALSVDTCVDLSMIYGR